MGVKEPYFLFLDAEINHNVPLPAQIIEIQEKTNTVFYSMSKSDSLIIIKKEKAFSCSSHYGKNVTST